MSKWLGRPFELANIHETTRVDVEHRVHLRQELSNDALRTMQTRSRLELGAVARRREIAPSWGGPHHAP